jgi:hypothetical protein
MYTMPPCIGRLGVRSLLSAVAVASALRGASTLAPPRPISIRVPAMASLPMAEIQFSSARGALAATRAPALRGEPVPSRWSQSDRPIGWEAMRATERAALEQARGEPEERPERATPPTLALADSPDW